MASRRVEASSLAECGWRDNEIVGESPTGTVTFLFTDVEGSTRLWQERGEQMRDALENHDAVIRAAVECHGGAVFSTAGDGFGAAFSNADEAVAAAASAQGQLSSSGVPSALVLRVRMGIHTGTAEERNGDYFGPTVNRAARVMSVGHGGQVLISDVTRRLLNRTDLVDLGDVALKDIDGLERVWQLGRVDHPPLRSGRRRHSNLPTPTRALIGRDEELQLLTEEVHPGRVVTLTGIGGIGKTRLALQLGEGLETRFTDGTWWCDLAPVVEPAGVAAAVCVVVAARVEPDRTLIDAVIDALRDRRALLVIDNCEHLLGPVATLIEAILAHCPTVACLATSREPLAIAAEQIWPLGVMRPDGDGAVLFGARAKAADPTFDVAAERSVVVELCRRLDGIPLAIELAAARVRSMTPVEMLAALDDRFRLLRGSARGGPDRHRTMLATLDWSYELLAEDERELLSRLAVFGGSFDGHAAAQVCAGDLVAEQEVRDLLAALVDRSLVVGERNRAGTRFRLLETVRQYGEHHLVAQNALNAWRDRHLDYYEESAHQAFVGWVDEYVPGRRFLDAEWDNVRAAVQHALRRRDSGRLSELFRRLCHPTMCELRYEMFDWAREASLLPDATAYTLGAAGLHAGMVGDFDAQVRFAERGLQVAPSPESEAAMNCWSALNGAHTRDRLGAGADDARRRVPVHRTAGRLGGGVLPPLLGGSPVRIRRRFRGGGPIRQAGRVHAFGPERPVRGAHKGLSGHPLRKRWRT